MNFVISFLIITFMTLISNTNIVAQVSGTYTDKRDGKTYKTVVIGTQTWMAENIAFNTGNGCYTLYDKSDNIKIYGFLYDWESAKLACPKGWHLPSDEEWTTLADFLGGKYVAGGKLKESGYKHWLKPNIGATDSIGFSALPGGNRSENGRYYNDKLYGRWWSSTEININSAWCRYLYYDNIIFKGCSSNKKNCFSVRCVMD